MIRGFVTLALILGVFAGGAFFLVDRVIADRGCGDMDENQCVVALRQIDDAKTRWATVHQKSKGAMPTAADLAVYLPYQEMPVCPDGGTYTIGPIGKAPKCSKWGHKLAE
jgi:hypothetical protein